MRARLQLDGYRLNLGEFGTQAEVDAARTAGLKVRQHLEAKQSQRQNQMRPAVPRVEAVARLVEMGAFDRQATGLVELARVLIGRHRMIKAQCTQATPARCVLSRDYLGIL